MAGRIVLIGRPNVGKSTLFNKLTNSRDALVADVPGLTRDRRYGVLRLDEGSLVLIDTGGLFGNEDIAAPLERQVEAALDEADLVLFVTDAREGLTPLDQEIAIRLRKRNLDSLLVVNKIDGKSEAEVWAEFSTLGYDAPIFVAAAHGRGIHLLNEAIALRLASALETFVEPVNEGAIRVAIVGRPNVGKSTLTNRLLGEERQVVFDAPGTTRDAIDIPLCHDEVDYVLIDTAGVRRKGRTVEIVEKFSVVKTLQAMERAQVVLVVLDATEGVVDQDLHLIQYAIEAGAGVILVINKWDGLSADTRQQVRRSMDRRLDFAPWMLQQTISALHGTGVGHLWAQIREVYASGQLDISSSKLTQLLDELVKTHPPPAVRGRSIKLRFAQKVGHHPPHIVIHGNQTDSVPKSYIRYLENGFRQALNIKGNPVRISLRSSINPYAGNKNELTPRQQRQRDRVIAHRKKR